MVNERQSETNPSPFAGWGLPAGEALGDASKSDTDVRSGGCEEPGVLAGTRARPLLGDGVEPDGRSDSALVKTKKSISAVRNLRDGLVQVVHWLSERPAIRGYLLLIDPQLSRSLLQREVAGFLGAMRPEVACRLHLIVGDHGQLERGGPLGLDAQEIPDDDRDLLVRCLTMASDPQTVLPSPRKREEVLWVLLARWVRGAGPVKAMQLERIVGCNYRTVAAVVEKIRPALAEHSDRQIELTRFPEEAWRESLAIQRKARGTMLYAFPSDSHRTIAERGAALLEALQSLGRSDLAVGGAAGAVRHHPGLRCPVAVRLDLCVHAPRKSVDLDFLAQLAPSLRPLDASDRPADVTLRFVRRRESIFATGEDGPPRADPIECLLGLYDARLTLQAEAFETHLREQGERSRAKPRTSVSGMHLAVDIYP